MIVVSASPSSACIFLYVGSELLVTFKTKTQTLVSSVAVVMGPKKKDSCVQVSEVKKIRVGRSKNIFILDFCFHYKCTEVLIEDRVLEVSFLNQSAHCID